MKRFLFFVFLLAVTCGENVVFAETAPNLSQPLTQKIVTWQEIPRNPVVAQDTITFFDSELKTIGKMLKQDQTLSIQSIETNAFGQPVFRLKTGEYLLASRTAILDDQILWQKPEQTTYWTMTEVPTYASPYVLGVDVRDQKLPAYRRVETIESAQTFHGLYVKTSDGFWVDKKNLVTEDLRMQAVQDLLDKKYNKSNLAIYVKQIDTQKEAGINADQPMYSASVTKLPVIYYAQRQLNKGANQIDQKFRYTPEVNDYDGAYDPAGSAILPLEPDNKEYSLEELLLAITKASDNVASNLIGYYTADQFDKKYEQLITKLAGKKWDMVDREVTVKMAGSVMEAMYEQGGVVMDMLSDTAFDNQRISKDIPVKVAHKIGDAYDFKHDVAVVYSDSPFILSIFTDQASYDDITAIANDVYNILK